MKKSFYITSFILFLSMFLVGETLHFLAISNAYEMPIVSQFSNTEINNLFGKIGIIFVSFLSGAFANDKVTFFLNMIYILLTTYLIYLVLKRTMTNRVAMIMSMMFLSIPILNNSLSLPYICFLTFLSALAIWLYFFNYDGVLKWYLIQIIIAIISVHYNVFIFVIYIFPLIIFNKIKLHKTSWTSFLHTIAMLFLAFILHKIFVNNFPIVFNQSLLNFDLKRLITIQNIIYLCMILFSLIGMFFCQRYIKKYIFYGIMSFIVCVFILCLYDSLTIGIMFLPAIYVCFANVLCHLPIFIKNKMYFIICFTLLTTVLSVINLLF